MAALRTLVDLFETAAAESPDRAMLRSRVGVEWRSISFARFRHTSATWARALCALGLQKGDRVLVAAQTSPEWVIADVAVLLAGGVTVPVYQSAMPDEMHYIAENSGARFAFVEDPLQLEKLLSHRDRLPSLEKIVWFKAAAELDKPDAHGRTSLQLDAILQQPDPSVLSVDDLGKLARGVDEAVLRERRAALDPLDPATIVYTSGTTGFPKGVVLTHDAFVFETGAGVEALDIRSVDTLFLFLPLAHIFARLIAFGCIRQATEMAFPRSMATLLEDVAAVQPTLMPSVPRIFEKAHAKILSNAHRAGGVKKRIFDLALATGREMSQVQQRGRTPGPFLVARHKLAHELVFSKIHATFGGKIRAFVSGGAPLSKDLAEFFHACGLLILEGYGLTENSAAATVNRAEHYKFGTVGKPLTGVDVAIAPDGEVLIRGRNVMTGYWNNPEATREALIDGWLHTGDIGELDADGFLRITDRKKDIIVTAGGKNVAPQNLESLIKSSPFISQVLVYGDRRKFLSALVTLDEATIRKWAEDHGVAFASFAELTQNAEVYKLVEGIVAAKNRQLASYETIKKFAILDHDLTVEEGHLTPSLKMRRKEVTLKYQDLLDSFYSEHY
jgi:long-chain acyl-CoA synthetase